MAQVEREDEQQEQADHIGQPPQPSSLEHALLVPHQEPAQNLQAICSVLLIKIGEGDRLVLACHGIRIERWIVKHDSLLFLRSATRRRGSQPAHSKTAQMLERMPNLECERRIHLSLAPRTLCRQFCRADVLQELYLIEGECASPHLSNFA